MNYDVVTYEDPLQIANAFSDFLKFTANIAQVLNVAWTKLIFSVTQGGIFAVINNLKDTSPSLDDIHSCRLKMMAQLISIALANMINVFFKTVIFPCILRNTEVIPVFKKGDKPNISNCHPIYLPLAR